MIVNSERALNVLSQSLSLKGGKHPMKLIPLSMGDLIYRFLTCCLQLCDTFGNSGGRVP